MHHLAVLLWVVAALLPDGVAKAAESQKRTPDLHALTRPTTTGRHEVPSERLLIIHKATGDDDDNDDNERGVGISAVNTLTDQLEVLLKKGESADDVFKLLTLDMAADDLLANPQLNDWINYMKLFNKQNPKTQTSLITTLTTHYGDEGLAKIIKAAKQVPSTATIAKRLQTEQIHRWHVSGKPPDQVFMVLKLDEAGAELFTHSQVFTWVKYTDDFNKANPNKQKTLFSTLKTHYNEETLVRLLIAAKKVPNTENIAIRVQSEQRKLWLTDKKSPSDIFKLLELDKEGKTLFTSPLFNAWIKYTDEFNMIDPETKVTSMSTLKKHYDDDVLAKMILAARKSPSTTNISTRLESEQLQEWYSTLKPPNIVFKALKLDKTGSKLFEKPLFSVWTGYVNFISEVDPKIKVNLLTPLLKVYDEKKLSRILIAAKKVPSTKKIATELQDALFNRWLLEKTKPERVSSLLRVKGAEADDASKLLYEKYVESFNHLT